MLGRKRQIIGIDLGAARAKAIVLDYGKTDDDVYIRESSVHPLTDPDEPLSDVVRNLVRSLRTRCRDCAVTAWPTGSMLRIFDAKAEPALIKAVRTGRAAASDLFYEKLDDYIAECGPALNLNGNAAEGTYVACGIPRRQLTTVRDVLRKLGFRLRLFQLTPVAVLNAFTASQTEEARTGPFFVVDFGTARMTLIAGHGGSVRVIRRVEFPFGEVPEPPIPLEDTGSSAEAEHGANQAMDAMFGDLADQLAAEIRPVLHAFQMHDQSENQTSEMDFSVQDSAGLFRRIFVCGALSNHGPMMRRIGATLNVECLPWNPFRHIAAHRIVLEDFTLLRELQFLPAAAGAAFQYAA